VQDSLVGSYLMTKDKLAITGEQLFHYLMPIIQLKSDFNYLEARKKRFWTGQELFSIIMPNVSLKNSKIEIHNGHIVDGYMDKKTLGGGPNGIIQAIFNQFGSTVCRDFLDNLQRLVVAWMEEVGFTVGFGDAIPSKETRMKIQEVLQNKMLKSNELIRRAQLGLFKPELSDSLRSSALEIEINNISAEATSEVETIVQDNLPPDNHFIETVKSGSKGNFTNLNQIMGTIGQQIVDGKRINFGWTGRTLAHFTKWDNSLSSRGFVYSSYMSGMRPQEFFYAAMGTRVGSINTSIRTAETGYIQRRLIKSMEDLYVAYDDTVRDASGNIVQYTYGLDGFDPVKLEHIPLDLINMSNSDMETEYILTVDTLFDNVVTSDAYEKVQKENKEQDKLLEEEWEQIKEDRRVLREEIFSNNKSLDISVLSPINFKRLIQEISDQFQINENDLSDLTPKDVIEEVRKLVDFTVKYTVNKKAFPILKILLRSNLSAKQCIVKYRMPKSVFIHTLETIRMKITYAYINPGEMVGIVAAQSIGEPLTQLSIRENEKVQICYKDNEQMKIYQGTFKDFIDNQMKNNKDKTFTDKEDSSYLDLEEPFYVAGVNQQEKVTWNKISQLTRHLPRGDLVKITTKSGRETTCTLSHSFLKRGERSVDPIKGSELKIGDRVPVISKMDAPNIGDEQKVIRGNKITKQFCWKIGNYIRRRNKNSSIIKSLCENGIPDFMFQVSDINKIKSFIEGMMYYDKYFYGDRKLLEQLALLLARTGKFTSIEKVDNYYKLKIEEYGEDIIPNLKNCLKRLSDNLNHNIVVSDEIERNTLTDYYDKFIKQVEENPNYNTDKVKYDLETIKQAITSNVVWDRIENIEIIKEPEEYVYDFTVPGNETFAVANGIIVHNTLNTFHFAGVGAKSMITNAGVPRIQEIINMSKDIKTPSMVIYLKPEYCMNRDVAMEVKNTLKYTEIKDILSHSEILYMPQLEKGKYPEEEEAYQVYEEMMELMEMECSDPNSLSNWMLWMEFDREAMLQRGIYMQDIYDELIENCNVDTDIQCVVPDMNSSNLTLRIRVKQDFEDGEDYIEFFRSMGDDLLTLPLRGVPGIKNVALDKESKLSYDVNGKPEIVKEWILKTDGSNLIEVLSNDYVDAKRTITNDISEIHKLYGIEGARYSIIREIETTIGNGGASEIDYRHFSILADLMTYRGIVMQIQRHGFGKSPYIGPIGRATYEVMDRVLINAGIFAETDDMKGTSANIVMGQSVRTGTDAFNIILNKDLLPDEIDQVNTMLPPEPNVNEMAEVKQTPTLAPLENMEEFEFGDDFMDKMAESKEVKLEDYMRTIGTRPMEVDETDFNFGYDIQSFEEHMLPKSEFETDIKINIEKSKQVTNNRRRRKK
jgi:DNA-directed RNA polymerase beta' subunit